MCGFVLDFSFAFRFELPRTKVVTDRHTAGCRWVGGSGLACWTELAGLSGW